MARVVLCLAALVVAAAAFPSNFVRFDRYSTNALCAAGTTTPSSSQYYAIDQCVVASTGSTKYSLASDNMNTVQWWSFTGTTCAGTPTLVSNTSMTGCGAIGVQRAVALSSSVGLWGLTSYSDNGCATATSGPTFGTGGCNGFASYTVGGKLEICVSGAADCSGDATCVSLSHNDCEAAQDGSSGSVLYDWNAASSATPAVALTAALIAVVAAVTKF